MAKSDVVENAAADRRSAGADSIGRIEIEMLKLVRHLETFGRRGELYVRVDRAGYLALRTLADLGPMSVNALAQELHLDSSTVTRQTASLEKAKLVERRPDPADGRSSSILLTAAGRRTMQSVETQRRRLIEEMLGDWDGDELDILGRVMGNLNVAIARTMAVLRDEPRRARPKRPSPS
jgi:DNA-binding MarR family transcriptional regulator